MLSDRCVADGFRKVLRRDPSPSELETYSAGSPNEDWLERQLRECEEYRSVVAPLSDLLRREWRVWKFREPTGAELAAGIAGTRHKCGGDEGVRRALEDGSMDTRLDFRPLTMEIDITNQCNLRCTMCQFSQPSYYRNPRRHLPIEKFQEIAEQVFPRTDVLSLSFGAEPLLHAHLPEMFAALEKYRVRHTYMNTNGLLLREPIMEAMIDHGFRSLLVSIDAATAEVYESIRIGGRFDTLVSNLRRLQEMKARRGVSHPDLRLGFVIMRQNMHELPAFVDFAADLGAVAVNAMHMISWESVGNAPMAAVHEKERCNRYLGEARQRAAERGIGFVGPDAFAVRSGHGPLVDELTERSTAFGINPLGNEAKTCPFPTSWAGVDMHGQVVPCGWWHEEKPMGNVYQQDFLSIWRGAAYESLRQRHVEGRFVGPCSRCPAAGMGCPDGELAFSAR